MSKLRRSRTNGARLAPCRSLRLRMSATNSLICGTFGCFQYHSKTQVPIRASGGSAFEDFQLLLRPGDMKPLVETELDSLFERS